jgi:hypothetical protein
MRLDASSRGAREKGDQPLTGGSRRIGPPLADVEFGMTESNKEDAVTVFLSVEPAHPPAAIERRSL